MFLIGDKVDFPVTQSSNINNILNPTARVLIQTAKNRHEDYLVIKAISGDVFLVGINETGSSVTAKFDRHDLVPYGHGNVLYAPMEVGDRVKCHCGKTHQIITLNNNTVGGIYKELIDTAGWYLRYNSSTIRKPRGQREYVYYVAYCPECWEAEKRRRLNAEAVNDRINSITTATVRAVPNDFTSVDAGRIRTPVTAEPPRPAPDFMAELLQQRANATTGSAMSQRQIISESPPQQKPQITKPFSIWIHQKGGRTT